MIGYVTIGTNDLPRAVAFYEKLLAPLGAKEMWRSAQGVGFGVAMDKPMVAVVTPFDGRPATAGNGMMVSLAVLKPAQVDEIHKLALALGGTDEGPPGPRGAGFYVGYFRDLDGNKLSVACYG